MRRYNRDFTLKITFLKLSEKDEVELSKKGVLFPKISSIFRKRDHCPAHRKKPGKNQEKEQIQIHFPELRIILSVRSFPWG